MAQEVYMVTVTPMVEIQLQVGLLTKLVGSTLEGGCCFCTKRKLCQNIKHVEL